MSRKHFNDLAEELEWLKPAPEEPAILHRQWEHLVLRMAGFCSRHNSSFNRSRFLQACNYDKDDP